MSEPQRKAILLRAPVGNFVDVEIATYAAPGRAIPIETLLNRIRDWVAVMEDVLVTSERALAEEERGETVTVEELRARIQAPEAAERVEG